MHIKKNLLLAFSARLSKKIHFLLMLDNQRDAKDFSFSVVNFRHKQASCHRRKALQISPASAGMGYASSHPAQAPQMQSPANISPREQSRRIGQTTRRRAASLRLACDAARMAGADARMLSTFPRRLSHHRSEKQGHKVKNEKSRHPEKHVIKCYSTVPETHFAIEVKTLEAHVSQADGVYFPITSYAFPRFGFSLRMARNLRVPPQSIQPAVGMISSTVNKATKQQSK